MTHSTCIQLDRVGFFFAVLSPAAFVVTMSGVVPITSADFTMELCAFAAAAAFVLGAVGFWTCRLRHRSQPRPGFAAAAHLIGALEVGLLVLMFLAWPKR